MKRLTRASFVLALILPAGLFWSWRESSSPDVIIYSKPTSTPITMCGSFSFDWRDTTTANAKIFPGLGNLRYPVSTTSLKAQEFFEQGLRLVYGFNHWEAIQSFRE